MSKSCYLLNVITSPSLCFLIFNFDLKSCDVLQQAICPLKKKLDLPTTKIRE